MNGFRTKLAVLVAAVSVCPGIHKMRVSTQHDSEGWVSLPY